MASDKEQKKTDSRTGKYVYDAKLGKVVKVSDDIPGLKKGGSPQGGACPMNPGGHVCGGGCGCGG
ncbi:MAG: hypothetical protein M0011_06680 [Elusimicrobia bacterium]|nr:hypothetical protein [Elusimicrobiota bacterium]